MWSIWPDSADVYLGQSVSMLKLRRGQALVVNHSATLPLDRVLQQLASLGSKHLAERSRLRISLGGALCPAISFTVPQGLRGWRELLGVACAGAAATLGGDACDYKCEMDPAQPGLAAAMPTGLQGELTGWAKQQGWQVASLQPLWAQASLAAGARSTSTSGLLLQEPDSVTILLADAQGVRHAATLHEAADSTALQPAVGRWLASHDASGDRLFKLGFGSSVQSAHTDTPRAWRSHWYMQ